MVEEANAMSFSFGWGKKDFGAQFGCCGQEKKENGEEIKIWAQFGCCGRK